MDHGVLVIRIVVESVENEVVLEARVAIDTENAFASRRHDGSHGIYSRRQEHEIRIESPVERQV